MTRDQIIQQLASLIAEARRADKWLFCQYQQLWFSPDELAKENADGRFVWSPANWKLRDPNDKLQELEDLIGNTRREIERFRQRMNP